MKTMFLLIVALSTLNFLASGETIMDRLLSQACCSSCPENNVNSSTSLSNKYKNLILNALSNNFNSTNFLLGLRNFPPTSSVALSKDINEFDFRNSSMYASRGGIDPQGKSLSLVDQGTINFLLNVTKSVIQSNLNNQSLNFINTYANFVETLRISYNNMTVQLQQSGTLLDGTSGSTQFLNYFTMSLALNLISGLTNQQQRSIQNCIIYANSNFVSSSPNVNMQWALPMQEDYFDPMTNNFDSSYLMNSNQMYFWKKTTIPDDFCPLASTIDGIVNNSSRRLTGTTNSTGTISLKTFNIWFERRLENEPSIYEPIYMDMFKRLDFNGLVYNPDNQNLSSLPNGGFGPNEDAFQIWNKIANKVFRPLLYYKIPGLASALQQTCPMTCNQAC